MDSIKNIFTFIIFSLFAFSVNVAYAAAPVASSDSYDVDENDFLIVVDPGVLTNDTDGDSDPLTAILVDDVSNGTLNLADDGSFTYEPTLEFDGIDTFTYKANDGTEDSATTTVTITVNDTDPADVTAPSVPSGLAVDMQSGTYMRIQWNASSDNEEMAGYKVYRSTGGSFDLIGEVDGISFADTGLTESTSYQYKVSAVDASDNESAQTAAISPSTEADDEFKLLLDTGTPASVLSGYTLSSSNNGFARKFTIDEAEVISSISTFIRTNGVSATQVTIAVYEDDGEIPDVSNEVESTTIVFTPGQSNEVGWRTTDDLNWYLPAGDYWLALEYRSGDSFSGFVPLVSTDYDIDGAAAASSDYSESDVEYGFRMYGGIAPVISSVNSGSITTSGAVITWTTDEVSDSYVEYGLTSSYGSSQSSADLIANHSITLSSLQADSVYYYRIRSTDADGNPVYSSQGTFRTEEEARRRSSGGGGGGGGGGRKKTATTTTTIAATTVTTTSVAAPSSGSSVCLSVPVKLMLPVGTIGAHVLVLQQFLNNNGYMVAAVGAGSKGFETNYFGPATQAAYARLQASCSSSVTTAVIPTTSTVTTTSTTFYRDLMMGSEGGDVVNLQNILISKGYLTMPAGVPLGYFGNRTRDGLMLYQQAMGIVPATGYFGPLTQASIK